MLLSEITDYVSGPNIYQNDFCSYAQHLLMSETLVLSSLVTPCAVLCRDEWPCGTRAIMGAKVVVESITGLQFVFFILFPRLLGCARLALSNRPNHDLTRATVLDSNPNASRARIRILRVSHQRKGCKLCWNGGIVVLEACTANWKYLEERGFLPHALSYRCVTFRTLSQSNKSLCFFLHILDTKPTLGVRHGQKHPTVKGLKGPRRRNKTQVWFIWKIASLKYHWCHF